jgi:hypothetical protein
MNFFRLLLVAAACVMLTLPVWAMQPCCCARAGTACDVVSAEGGKTCCQDRPATRSCCANKSSKRSCCTADPSKTSSSSSDQDGAASKTSCVKVCNCAVPWSAISLAWSGQTTSDEFDAPGQLAPELIGLLDDLSLRQSAVPIGRMALECPQPGNNLRQAILCVWLK